MWFREFLRKLASLFILSECCPHFFASVWISVEFFRLKMARLTGSRLTSNFVEWDCYRLIDLQKVGFELANHWFQDYLSFWPYRYHFSALATIWVVRLLRVQRLTHLLARLMLLVTRSQLHMRPRCQRPSKTESAATAYLFLSFLKIF